MLSYDPVLGLVLVVLMSMTVFVFGTVSVSMHDLCLWGGRVGSGE